MKIFRGLFIVLAILNFSISLNAQTYLTENFEHAGNLPPDWTTQIVSGYYDWGIDEGDTRGPGYAQEGTYCAYLPDYTGGIEVLLISPVINLSSATQPELRFWCQHYYGSTKIQVRISTDGTYPTISDESATILYEAPSEIAEWEEIVIDLSAYVGESNVQIYFDAFTHNDYYFTHIDNISIAEPPTCPVPTNLSATTTANSANLDWNSGNTETNWNIEYGEENFSIGSGTSVSASGSSNKTITGLSSATVYDFYVQANCGSETSPWVGPYSFVTDCSSSSSVPFAEGFNNGFGSFRNGLTQHFNFEIENNIVQEGEGSIHLTTSDKYPNPITIQNTCPIDFTTYTGTPKLTFWHIAKTNNDLQRCYVKISTDGGVTFSILPYTIYEGDGDDYNSYYQFFDEDTYPDVWKVTGEETPNNSWWKKETFNLSAYASETNVIIQFAVESDGDLDKAGWYIDNIKIDNGIESSTPFITTNTATNITDNSATLNGNIVSNGGFTITESGFVYSTTSNPTIGGVGVIQIQTSPTITTGDYSENISDLTINQTYYYKAYATNSEGTAYGIEKSFVAQSEPTYAPTVETNSAANISYTTATINGEITSDGGASITESGFVYSTTNNPIIGEPGVIQVQTSPVITSGTFSSNLSSLEEGTMYYYKAYAINLSGVGYGNQESFTTDAQAGANDILITNGSVSVCSGTFYDDGFTSNYSNNADYTFTIYPETAGNKISVEFLSYDLEPSGSTECYDYLNIYDGTDENGELLWDLCDWNPGTVTATNSNGALTFVFHSDNSVTKTGWEANINCTTPTNVTEINNLKISIYPNPISSILTIKELPENSNISIFDICRKEVFSKKIINNTIDLSELKTGVYFLNISSKEINTNLKFVKE